MSYGQEANCRKYRHWIRIYLQGDHSTQHVKMQEVSINIGTFSNVFCELENGVLQKIKNVFQGSVWNLNIFKLRFLIQVLQIWLVENFWKTYAEMKVWFVWECPEMLQLILLYQAQFKFKLNFTYFPTHITLSTVWTLNIMLHVDLNDRRILIYSMYWGWLVTLKSSNMWARNSKVGLLNGSCFQHSNMICNKVPYRNC